MTDNSEPDPWTDEHIREAFIDDGGQSEFYDPIHGAQTQRRVAGAIFDRWLTARDAKIRAEREPVVVDDATMRLVEVARGVTEWMALHADAQDDARKVDAALDALLAALTPDGQEGDRG